MRRQGCPRCQTPAATRRGQSSKPKASQRGQRAQRGPGVGCGYRWPHPSRLWRREGCPKSAVSGSQPLQRGLGCSRIESSIDSEYSPGPCRSRFALSARSLNQAPGKLATTQRPPPVSCAAAADAPAVLLEAFDCTAAVRRSQQAPCVPVMCHGRRSLAATPSAAV